MLYCSSIPKNIWTTYKNWLSPKEVDSELPETFGVIRWEMPKKFPGVQEDKPCCRMSNQIKNRHVDTTENRSPQYKQNFSKMPPPTPSGGKHKDVLFMFRRPLLFAWQVSNIMYRTK